MIRKVLYWDKKEALHIETPNGIVNIRCNLTDLRGRAVDSIEIIPDRYAGENKVKVMPSRHNVRLIRLKTVKSY